MRARRHLVVFLKAPRLGQVKSRLAAGIGWVEATRFHRAEAQRLIRATGRDRRWRTTLWIAPSGAQGHRDLPGLGLPRFDQGQGDLGRRMARPFRRLPGGDVVLVGCDVTQLGAAEVARAFRSLRANDAVFGPAHDGGYWLVGLKGGLRRRPPFRDVRWSTRHALADTLANLGRARVALLPPLGDIDTARDYRRWRSSSR
jgi:rSAM/selenodomain-associated transferase 1